MANKTTEKYVAYISSYTSGKKNNYGIRIYDVDLKAGTLKEKDKVEITNSSYLTISHNHKIHYQHCYSHENKRNASIYVSLYIG